MVFKALPVGVSRNVDGSVLPLVSGDGTVVGFSSSQGDTFMPALAVDPLTGGIVGLMGPDGSFVQLVKPSMPFSGVQHVPF